MNGEEINKEYENLKGLFEAAGAEANQMLICDSLILECARATVQLNELNAITTRTGLVKVHPDYPDIQKPLPVATELTKVRASLTNMLTKLNKMLCVGMEEEFNDLDEFE